MGTNLMGFNWWFSHLIGTLGLNFHCVINNSIYGTCDVLGGLQEYVKILFCINKCIINLIEKDSNSHTHHECVIQDCIVIQLPKYIQNESRSHLTWGKGTIAQVCLLWNPVCLSFSIQWCAHKIPLRRTQDSSRWVPCTKLHMLSPGFLSQATNRGTG